MEPGVGAALAMLVAGTITHHLLNHEGDCDEKCCTECCAPCSALSYLRSTHPEELAAAFVAWDPNWDWCNPDGTIKWELLEDHWGNPSCLPYHEGSGDMC